MTRTATKRPGSAPTPSEPMSLNPPGEKNVTRDSTAAGAASTTDSFGRTPEFIMVGDLHPPLARATSLAKGLALLAAGADEEHAEPLCEMAWVIHDLLKQIGEQRSALWRRLHPSREHFDAVGWPSEEFAA